MQVPVLPAPINVTLTVPEAPNFNKSSREAVRGGKAFEPMCLKVCVGQTPTQADAESHACILMYTGGEVPHQNTGALSHRTEGLGTRFRQSFPPASSPAKIPPAAAETSPAVAC